jgi:quinol monooxygenase YgiN
MDEHPVIALVRSRVPDPRRPFTIIADLAAHPGRGGEVAAAIAGSGAVGLTRAEPGCLGYEISQDSDAPDRFVVYELWQNLAALRAHLGTAHFAAVGAALGGLLAGTPTVRVLTPVVPDAEPCAATDGGGTTAVREE